MFISFAFSVCLLNRGNFKETYEEVSKNSIWRQITTHIPLKAGRRTFQMIDNRYTDPMELKPISASVFLPTSVITDPVREAFDRIIFRRAKRTDP
jgi:hypothetical protein